MGNETFFEGLGLVGWLGVFLWLVFFATVLFKFEWYSKYDERIPPRMSFVDEFLYEDWHFILFMAVRFLLIVVILTIISRIMFMF